MREGNLGQPRMTRRALGASAAALALGLPAVARAQFSP